MASSGAVYRAYAIALSPMTNIPGVAGQTHLGIPSALPLPSTS